MINILVPIAGKSYFFDANKDGFAKPFVEICGKTMLELFIANYECVKNKRFIFILRNEDVKKFHLDEAILVLDKNAKIIILKNESAGMACSAMMAVDYIENDDELIIANLDQIFDLNLDKELVKFSGFDAGVLSFEAIHPRYAYVKTDENDLILGAFEKKPVSKNAIAGFYYFARGKDFINGAKMMIKKDAKCDDKFYIAPVLNELILQNKRVKNVKIDKNAYHSFYSPAKIAEFEQNRS